MAIQCSNRHRLAETYEGQGTEWFENGKKLRSQWRQKRAVLWVTRRNTETDHKRAADALALKRVLELVTSLLDVYHSSDQLYCAWQHLHLTQTGGWYWISVWPLMRKNRYFIVKWTEVKREWPINLLPHLCQNIPHYSISTYLLLWLQSICNSRFFSFILPLCYRN